MYGSFFKHQVEQTFFPLLFFHFRYSVSEHRWTQMLTSAVEEGSIPSSRYHHAASLVTLHDAASHGTSHSFMLVVGGVTSNGVASDTWSLNLSSLIWREHPVRSRVHIDMEINCSTCLFFFFFCKCTFPVTPDRARCCPRWRVIP